jgi:aconitate hydratase
MGQNLTHKIIQAHLVEGEMIPGKEICIKIDQTLTQDSTGTMVYLEFNAIGIPRVKTELSVSYVDHNTLQTGFENADDHRFLQSAAKKYGIHFSRAGNGICHQVHLERFSIPGKTLLGSDSHTPTCGGMGMLAIGAGGLDVAVAMAGYPYYLRMPEVINIRLHGKPAPWVSAKDIILEVLRRLTVKGGVGKVIEYSGDGILHLDVPQRATITNMGAELGATSSIFPSDVVTRSFLIKQGREKDYIEFGPDIDANYDQVLDINLDELEPLVALPHMPDRVVRVAEKQGLVIDQVFIGSCTNSSYSDLMRVAKILKGKTVHPSVSLVIAPGSRQVMYNLAANGALADLVSAGARILECACGPCVGIGQAPPTKGISLRTSNRNFKGRSGTADAEVYLVSCETAAVSAIYGKLTDPRVLGEQIIIELPERFAVDDSMIIPPGDSSNTELIMGPNIKPLPDFEPLQDTIRGEVLLKVNDDITTDHIMPAGAKIMSLRSNIPAISQHVFEVVDPTFAKRARESGGGIIVGGENYGQGSSREHAAIAPKHLGIKVVLVKSFARIHQQNLINFGILPLMFVDKEQYLDIEQGDILEIKNILNLLEKDELVVCNKRNNKLYRVKHNLSERQVNILLEGGLLQHVKNKLRNYMKQ